MLSSSEIVDDPEYFPPVLQLHVRPRILCSVWNSDTIQRDAAYTCAAIGFVMARRYAYHTIPSQRQVRDWGSTVAQTHSSSSSSSPSSSSTLLYTYVWLALGFCLFRLSKRH